MKGRMSKSKVHVYGGESRVPGVRTTRMIEAQVRKRTPAMTAHGTLHTGCCGCLEALECGVRACVVERRPVEWE